MRTAKKLGFGILGGLFLFLHGLTDSSDYSEIKFQDFPAQYKQYKKHPWEMFDFDEFSAAYQKILDDFPRDQYLDDSISELFIVSEGNRFVSTDQGPFIFMDGCKPHFCGAFEVFVLYDLIGVKTWALVIDAGLFSSKYEEVWLGKPDQEQKNLLKKLIDMRWQ